MPSIPLEGVMLIRKDVEAGPLLFWLYINDFPYAIWATPYPKKASKQKFEKKRHQKRHITKILTHQEQVMNLRGRSEEINKRRQHIQLFDPRRPVSRLPNETMT